MKIPKSINLFRREAMHVLTKSIGRSHTISKLNSPSKSSIKKILICRPNQRLGNLLLITPLIQELTNTFPDCEIDLFTKGGLAPILFKNYTAVNTIICLPKRPFSNLIKYTKGWLSIRKKTYDLVVNGDKNSSSGRLSTQFAKAKYKVFGDVDAEIIQKHTDHEHIAKYPIYNLRSYLTLLGFSKNENPLFSLDIKLSNLELVEGQKALKKIVDNGKETICVFTYATGNKCHSKDWWTDFYRKLEAKFKNYNIIEILPIENVSQIDFKSPTFYSKDVREIAGLIANTKLFIGADSGIMHLSSAALTPTVGLFSVTKIDVYTPYNNNSIAIDTNKTSSTKLIEKIAQVLKQLSKN